MRCSCLVAFIAAMGCLFLAAEPVQAWGAHRWHAELVRKILAPALTAGDRPVFSDKELDEYVNLYAYYPDWGWGLTGKRPDERWGYFIETHKKRSLDGNTHSKRAALEYFKLMLETLASGESRQSLVWAGCLTHQIGDAVATNHPPLLMYMVYGLMPWNMTLGDTDKKIGSRGDWLDLAVAVDPAGKRYLQQELQDHRPRLLADNALDAAVQLQMILDKNFLLVLKHERAIAAAYEAWTARADPAARDKLAKLMAGVVAQCTRDAADVLYTAVELVRSKKSTFQVAEAQRKGAPQVKTLRQAHPLAGVSSYQDLLGGKAQRGAVGVFLGVPPCYWVTPGAIDLRDCYFLSVVARTLKREKIPCTILDIRKPPGRLAPNETPVIVLAPYRQEDGLVTADFEKTLSRYQADGGRILFIGGWPNYPALKPLADALMPSPNNDRHDYPVTPAQMARARIVVADGIVAPRNPPSFKIARVMSDFDTRGSGRLVLKPDRPKSVVPVLDLEVDGKRMAVSAAHVDNGAYRSIYAPWYLFMPCTFQKKTAVQDVHEPRLDAEGTAILKLLVERLKRSAVPQADAAPGAALGWPAVGLVVALACCRLARRPRQPLSRKLR
ncbi:MAG: hypothetical protein FJ271_08470 [Planctomycetes bacterium]|nr:hypothetical protein [Planctomycetota bacterium]